MRKISTDIIIIAILWISIIVSLTFNSNFNAFFIFGIAGLSIVTLTYKKFNEFSFGILALILLLSVFNVVTFSNAFYVNLGFINIVNLLLFGILFFTQISKFFELKDKWFADDESESESENHSTKKMKMFKTQFQNLSESELLRKLENEKLIDEAKNAIKEILFERNQ